MFDLKLFAFLALVAVSTTTADANSWLRRRLIGDPDVSVSLNTGLGGCSGTQEAVLDIYLGANSPSPTVLHLVGGAYMNLVQGTVDTAGQSYLDAGYTLAVLWYRIPRSSTNKQWLVCSDPFEAYADVEAAMMFLRANAGDYNIDPSAIVASGFSAGGHLASFYATTCTTDCPNAMVLHFPWLETGAKVFCTNTGSAFSSNNDFDACFPTALVDANTPPTVIYHASGDTVVPTSWMTAFVQSLSNENIPHEFYQVQGGGHYLVNFDRVVAASNGVLTGGSDYAELVERALLLLNDDDPSSAPVGGCNTCDDNPSGWMTSNGQTCETGTWSIQNRCFEEPNWIAAGYCRLSCFIAGRGYPGDDCCLIAPTSAPVSTPATPAPVATGGGCCTWGSWSTCPAWTQSSTNVAHQNQQECESRNGTWIP